MLYLIQSAGYSADGYIDLLKIGYAADMKARFSSYKLHNPTCKILKEIPGTLSDEGRVQYHFRKYRFTEYGNEWFVYSQEIIDWFNSPDFDRLEKDITLSHSRKIQLQNYVGTLSQRYFLKKRFSEDTKNFSDIKEVANLISPIYESLGKTIYRKEDVISEMSKILKCDMTSIMDTNSIAENVKAVLKKIKKCRLFPDKMKIVCTSGLNEVEQKQLLQNLDIAFSRYYYLLGPEKCRAVSYRRALLDGKLEKEEVAGKPLPEPVINEIYTEFLPGNRYTKSWIKTELGEIYRRNSVSQTAKASDLEEYFVLKSCLVANKETGKRDHGFEIIRRK